MPEANYDDDDDVDHDDGDNIWLHEYRTLLAQVGSSPALSRSGSTSSLASSLSCAPVQEVPPTAPAIILLIIPIITNNHNYASIILIIMRIIDNPNNKNHNYNATAGANPHDQLPTTAGPGDQGDQEVDVGKGHNHQII